MDRPIGAIAWPILAGVVLLLLVAQTIAGVAWYALSTNSRIETLESGQSQLRGELTATQTELGTTSNELSATKIELSSTKQELASTKTILTSTRESLAETQGDLLSTRTSLEAAQSDLAATRESLASMRRELDSTTPDLSSQMKGGPTISSTTPTFGRSLDSSRWLLHGSAKHLPSFRIIQLTPAERYQLGMLLHRQLTKPEGLKIEFSFEIGGGTGADGLGLLLLRSMPDFSQIDPRHDSGAGWGSRFLDGYAVVFDTFQNVMGDDYGLHHPITDPSDNFVALAELGAGSDVFDITHLETRNLNQPLSNSGVFDAEVEFNHDGRVRVYLSNAQAGMERTLVIDHTIDNYTPFEGYIGFIGATGNLTDQHFIHSVNIVGE